MIGLPKILFQNARFVVLDKPSGLAVHPGPRGGPSVEDIFPALSRRKDGPWLAHRLDADTSGCLLIALRKAALIAAQAEFAAGRARKTYWAVVRGAPTTDSGLIDTQIRRHTDKSGWRMEIHPTGQQAITAWRILGRDYEKTWLELRPRTGRTHQLRLHCAALGFPILGDPIYGDGQGKLHLMAQSLELDLDPPVTATAEPPSHMRAALAACGWQPPP